MAENKPWTLSEIAAVIGVSKTALYRHFTNRSEIEEAMNEELFEKIKDMFESLPPDMNTIENRRNVRRSIVLYLRENQGYLFLLMNHFFSDDNFAASLYERLKKETCGSANSLASMNTLSPDERRYALVTILKNWISILLASMRFEGMDSRQDELLDVLEKGFPWLTFPDQARMEELDAISSIGASELGKSNRLFNAISASIHTHGIAGTTIETIAEKMGTAKSSLYFYGRNKDAMLKDLITNETDTILGLCSSRAGRGNTFAEQIFILMMVHAHYLVMKPDIIPVFNWIRFETIKNKTESFKDHLKTESLLTPYRIRELSGDRENGKRYAIMALTWASILSTSCVIFGKKQGLDDASLRKNIYIMFESMMKGDN